MTAPPTVLIPTSRNHYRLVSYVTVTAVEDAMCARADADLLDVPPYTRRRYLRCLRQGRVRTPKVAPPRDRYDLCFLVAMDARWVASLRYVDRLRARCDRIVVYVFDAWLRDLHWLKRYRREWSQVDVVYVSYPWAVEPYRRALGCRVEYMPQAARAAYYRPDREERPIDVLSVGRRLESAHRRLLELADREDLFYHYSEAVRPQALDLRDSQTLLSRLSESAKAHVCWPVELTSPARGSEGSPVTVRWFEAAACGATVLGRRPASEEFDRLFPYENFVVEVDPAAPAEFDRRVLEALARDDRAERLELARHVREHHSWEGRCDAVLGCRAATEQPVHMMDA